jgi:protein disulfide-isomerase A6
LASILNKPSLSSDKLDEIKRKANVLKAFTGEKAEEAKEKAESIGARATAEL